MESVRFCVGQAADVHRGPRPLCPPAPKPAPLKLVALGSGRPRSPGEPPGWEKMGQFLPREAGRLLDPMFTAEPTTGKGTSLLVNQGTGRGSCQAVSRAAQGLGGSAAGRNVSLTSLGGVLVRKEGGIRRGEAVGPSPRQAGVPTNSRILFRGGPWETGELHTGAHLPSPSPQHRPCPCSLVQRAHCPAWQPPCRADQMTPSPPLGLPAVSLPGAWSGASLGRKGHSWIGAEPILGEGGEPRDALGVGRASWLEPQLRLLSGSFPAWTT